MSADPARAWFDTYLARQTLPDGHHDAWRWLGERVDWYPLDRKFPSWRRAKRKDPRRPIAMVGASPGVRTDDSKTTIAGLRLIGSFPDVAISASGGEDEALEVASALFGTRTRRTSLIVPDGTAWVFDAMIRQWVRPWVHAGYVVQPLVSGHAIKALIVRQGRYRWTLSDFEGMTATDPGQALDEARQLGIGSRWQDDDLRTLLAWVETLQRTVQASLGAYLRPTVGGTAVRAAAFDLPDDTWIPRTQPLLVTMCREGKGFRGGYIYGERFRGEAYKADVRRMYAWALSQSLGYRWALGPCVVDGVERPGIFVCTVSGIARHPVQLPTWRGSLEGFTTSLWSEGEDVAVVPSSEFEGLRALGLTVTPGYGFVATATLTFAPFVDRLQAFITAHGAESAAGRWAKLAGNTLYGKLAVNPHREGVVFSEERPEGRVFPLVTPDGDVFEDMWSVEQVHYAPSQQVAMASMITGYARTKLYGEIAKRVGEGRRVVHAHTDGLVVTGEPPADLPEETDTIGEWRLVGADPDTIVARAGGYVVGGEAKWSGAPSQGRRTVEVAWAGGDWLVAGRRAIADRSEG